MQTPRSALLSSPMHVCTTQCCWERENQFLSFSQRRYWFQPQVTRFCAMHFPQCLPQSPSCSSVGWCCLRGPQHLLLPAAPQSPCQPQSSVLALRVGNKKKKGKKYLNHLLRNGTVNLQPFLLLHCCQALFCSKSFSLL